MIQKLEGLQETFDPDNSLLMHPKLLRQRWNMSAASLAAWLESNQRTVERYCAESIPVPPRVQRTCWLLDYLFSSLGRVPKVLI